MRFDMKLLNTSRKVVIKLMTSPIAVVMEYWA